jgi:hypothetical protein
MNLRRDLALIVSTTLITVSCIAFAEDKPVIDSEGWQVLFDGKSMGKWKPSDFSGNGKIEVKDGAINVGIGKPMSGFSWKGEPPERMDYEIELEAMRTEGQDFFCGLTFPVGTNPCTFVVGGWGGTVVGLSSLDSFDASENETTKTMTFENKRWYRIRIRVTKSKIEAWIDKEKLVDVDISERRISVRWEVEPSIPLGVATWNTGSAVRKIRMRKYSS